MFLKPINIDSDIIKHDSPNYTLASWPPLDDAPITCDNHGNVISVFSDNVWDFTYYSKKTDKFNFGDESQLKGYIIDKDNIKLFKLIVTYWLWGVSPVITAQTIIAKCTLLKPLVYICSKNSILISELSHHEEIFSQIAKKYKTIKIIHLLESLTAFSEEIGFKILDEASLKKFSRYLPKYESCQTPYIPPRIWVYQVTRLESCIDDFLTHKEEIKLLFNFFTDIYPKTSFQYRKKMMPKKLEEYQLEPLFNKWLVLNQQFSLRNLSSYLSLVSNASMAYIMNFSLMRSLEANSLRYGCFVKEKIDDQEVCLIKGSTSKTIKDNDTSWVVPSSVEKVVNALEAICELRYKCAQIRFNITQDIKEFKPYLAINAFELWRNDNHTIDQLYLIKNPRKYIEQINVWKKYFEEDKLRITEEDLKIANHLTDNLNESIFKVGEVWPLAWHQLRRTGAVNMLASGMISDKTLQYQLKHANTIMSMYYANNFHKLKFKLNEAVGVVYFQERHQNNVRQNEALVDDRFISPHGDKRKAQIISTITEKDHKTLLRMSENGNLNYRETFLGGCTKRGDPCPYGGITNIVSCMGGDDSPPCEALLIDANKLNLMYKLETTYSNTIQDLAANLISSLFHEQQLKSIRKAIHVIESS